MKPVRLVLELDGETIDEKTIRTVLADAFAEYVEPRTPVDRFVAEQFGAAPESFREQKERDIAARVMLAQRLQRAVPRMAIEQFEELTEDEQTES